MITAGEKVVCIFVGQPYPGVIHTVFRRVHGVVFDVWWGGPKAPQPRTHDAADEGITWIQGDHALDSPEVRALMAAWALAGAGRGGRRPSYFAERRRR